MTNENLAKLKYYLEIHKWMRRAFYIQKKR